MTSFLDNATASGFIPAVLTGLAKPNAYGTLLRQFLDRIATPAGRAVLDFTLRNCAPADLLNFYKKSVISKNFQILGMSTSLFTGSLPHNPITT
jgi:hypothetical protein